MSKCKRCGVPLTGFLSRISGALFRIRPSKSDPEICNKCAPEAKKGKYVCNICNREIDEEVGLVHVKTEEYLLELIKRDHPEWKDDKACHHCVEYYRELIKKAEI